MRSFGKKRLILVFSIFMSFLLMACSNTFDKDNILSQNNKSIEEGGTRNSASTSPKELSKRQEITTPFGTLIDGRIPDIEVGIGTSYSDILTKWGNPLKSNIENGCLNLVYNKAILYLNSTDEKTGVVCAIKVLKGTQIYDVKVGMTEKEIIAIFGKPLIYDVPHRETQEGVFVYQIKPKMYLSFLIDQNGHTTEAILNDKNLQKLIIENNKENYPVDEKYINLIKDKNKEVRMMFGYSGGEMPVSEMYLCSNGLLIMDSVFFSDQKDKYFFKASLNDSSTLMTIYFIDKRIAFNPDRYRGYEDIVSVNENEKSITLRVGNDDGIRWMYFMNWLFTENDWTYLIGPIKLEI